MAYQPPLFGSKMLLNFQADSYPHTGSLFLVQSGINIHQAAFLIDRGLGAGVAGAAISVNAAFTGVGSILWGWVVDRIPVRYTFAAQTS